MNRTIYLILPLALFISGCGKKDEKQNTNSVSTINGVDASTAFREFFYSTDGQCDNYNLKLKRIELDTVNVAPRYKQFGKLYSEIYLRNDGKAMLHTWREDTSSTNSSITYEKNWNSFDWRIEKTQLIIEKFATADIVSFSSKNSGLSIKVNEDFMLEPGLASKRIDGAKEFWSQSVDLAGYGDQEKVIRCEDLISLINR